MPNNYTPNYHLNQWEPEDKVLRDDFNADNARIDGALKAEAEARAALAGRMVKLGNCQIWTGTYVGAGKFGPENARSITFPKPPVMVFIISDHGMPFTLMIRGMSMGRPCNHVTNVTTVTPTWKGNTLTWYSGHDSETAFNVEGTTYHVAALLAADQ